MNEPDKKPDAMPRKGKRMSPPEKTVNKEAGVIGFGGKWVDVAKILADSISGYPYLAFIVLVILIAAIAVTTGAGSAAMLFFLLVVLVAVGGGVYLLIVSTIGRQKQMNKAIAAESTTLPGPGELIELLSPEEKRNILEVMDAARNAVSQQLDLDVGHVRSNVFALGAGNTLAMVKELTLNMERQEELTITMPVGYGSTGKCFARREPGIAVFKEGWGEFAIADPELRKAHPDLQWIISIPIFLRIRNEKVPIWILNIDGLIDRRSEGQLSGAIPAILPFAQLLAILTNQVIQRAEVS